MHGDLAGRVIAADVRDLGSLCTASAAVEDRFGGYDTVVVNAGVGVPHRTFRTGEAAHEYEKMVPRLRERQVTTQSIGTAMAAAMVTRTDTLVFPARWRALEMLRGIWSTLRVQALSRSRQFAGVLALADKESGR
ncbi:hypothetical protein [Nocardia kruczakiae]|uniref:hypothetical protein n=1 Tax=Nocardia kruczakiae TaxID=261477 RepID=UPI0007A400D2|nr:hypothetical protein [Nocardia kruczakiae]